MQLVCRGQGRGTKRVRGRGAQDVGGAGTGKSLALPAKFRNFLEVAKDIPQIAGGERPLPPCLVCVHASVVRAQRGVGLSAERSDASCIAQC